MIPAVLSARRDRRAIGPHDGRTTDIPPPRYRVIEKDRRLIVIDRQSGAPMTPGARIAGLPMSAPTRVALKRVSFDGTADLVTHRLYDDKGPRTIRLDPGRAAMIQRIRLGGIVGIMVLAIAAIAWPWLLAIAFPLASDGVRKPMRARITRWLDQAKRESA